MNLWVTVATFLLVIKISFAQDQQNYELSDSVVVFGNKFSETGVNINSIDVTRLSSLGITNYDLLYSLSLIGANYQSDFNVVPLLEGADFQEQEFLIESIPFSYPINFLGVQSGLNSLLFSSIFLERNSLVTNCFSKTISLNASLNEFNHPRTLLKSRTSNLRTENLLYLPMDEINSRIIIGYHRSLFESMKPFYNAFLKSNDLNFRTFPFYEGFQSLIKSNFGDIKMTNLMMTNYDRGVIRISDKDFNFNSNSISIGSNLELSYLNSKSMLTFHYLKGINNINYEFNERSRRVVGAANLQDLRTGFQVKTNINVDDYDNLFFRFGYNYFEGYSKNESDFHMFQQNTIAKHNLDNIEGAIGYQKMFTNKISVRAITGLLYSSSNRIGLLSTADVLINVEENVDLNLIVGYKEDYLPTNAVFYSFQNSIWDPSSVNTLYFIDQTNLPIEPIRNLSISAHFDYRIKNNLFSSDLQVKLFFRNNNNLIFSNNYPLESTYYNTDFSFNQDYSAQKYGMIVSLAQNFLSISLMNRVSIGYIKSLNSDGYRSHHALNYNPFFITDLINWSYENFNITSLIMCKIGRYFFYKTLDKYYSYSDSTIAYSLSTDFSNQGNLDSQFRLDVAINYIILDKPLRLDIGLTVINVFNEDFESNRIFSFDSRNIDVLSISEFTSLPRFFIANFNIGYTF